MACIKGASRSATVAFAPASPYLAAGTMAGAVDLSFSSSANLEIFKLDFQSDDPELPVVGECASSERFHRLSWGGNPGSASDEYALGLIAGGLVDGSIGVWNPLKLISSEGNNDDAFVARLQKLSGPVRGLEFNNNAPNMLASGADGGEICIWDLSNPKEPHFFPILKSSGSGAQDEVSFLSWNQKVQHILASTSYNGVTVIWDLKRQKPVISFSDSKRRRCSVLQWHPDNATHLIVASDDDMYPSLSFWDVRNTISPVKEFVGHTKGVLAMSWCPSDSSFLLTCAKDNRTICWDTTHAEIVCELPPGTNWNFDIHWYPMISGLISASSFDGKIGIYNMEACPRLASAEGELAGTLSSSGSTGVHLRAPKWLKRPVGASFGFGGKLVSFHPSQSMSNSEVYVHNVVTELNLVNRSTEFEAAIQNGEKSLLRVLCERKSQESESEDDRRTWGFLKVMFEEEGTARTKLLSHLGFSAPFAEDDDNLQNELSQEMDNVLSLDERARSVEATNELAESSLPIDNGEDFFNNLQSPKADSSVSPGDGLVAESGSVPNGDEEHEIVEETDSSLDGDIQRALVVGDYKTAVSLCLSANRMADALVIAHLGGSSLWESTRDQYLKKSQCPYLKVVSAMVNNDLMKLVNTRSLNSWEETLALLCSFAQGEEWSILCDTLALRLMTAGNTLAATLCYICAGNIDKTVEIWSQSIKSDQEGRSYVDLLQDLMEKTIIFALATGQKQFSPSVSKLVENYAELLASQGLVTTALEYLKLLGTENSSHELSILRNRIALSTEGEEAPKSVPYDHSQAQTQPSYTADQPGFDLADPSQHYYQDKTQLQSPNIPGSPYEGYQQPFGSSSYVAQHQPVQPKKTTFYPSLSPSMFVPSQVSQAPQTSFVPSPATAQSAVRPFIPSTPPVLKNVEQYQQPTLGSQLYPQGVPAPSTYLTGTPGPSSFTAAPPSQVGPLTGVQLSQSMPAPRGFMPVSNQTFTPRPGVAPVQPPSPTQQASVQPLAAPPAPPPTVQTVDTSKVPAELKPVIATLTRLYNETTEILGGPAAGVAKKREIDDNSKKIGALFAKLNSGDISPNAASKLGQLCHALESSDFSSALHIQVLLTTSDWDECNFWLAALKRMIRTKQGRSH